MEESRVSVISIIIKDDDSVTEVNEILHDYRDYMVGRMGIPYRTRGISIISVVVDAPQAVTEEITGKLGSVAGVSIETLTANL